MFSALVLISWLAMYIIGLVVSAGVSFAYLQMTSASYTKCKTFAISLVWFIALPIVSCYVAWQRRTQIQALGEQFKMLQQMQEQMAAFQQLAALNTSTKGNEGDTFDQSYEQQS